MCSPSESLPIPTNLVATMGCGENVESGKDDSNLQEGASSQNGAVSSSNVRCRIGNGRKRGRAILKDEEVECSGCSRWVKASDLDIVGMMRCDVEKMEVFCIRCMHGMFSALRREVVEGREEIKSLREALAIISNQKRDEGNDSSSPTRNCTGASTEGQNITYAEVVHLPASPKPTGEGHTNCVNNSGFELVNRRKKLRKVEIAVTSTGVGGPSQVNMPMGQDRSDGQAASHPCSPISSITSLSSQAKGNTRKTINIIGDSMVRNITNTVKCEAEGSGCDSMRGAGVKQIMEKVVKTSSTLKEDGFLIVEGGGNSLNALGPDQTVECIMEAVKKVK